MTQEDKELLLRDLCARLPYDFYIKEEYGDYVYITLYSANIEHLIDRISDGLDKLVLRPMSSMTEEEKKEFENLLEGIEDGIERWDKPDICEEYDWLISHHFDYRGLIEKGLVIKVTEENDPYKK